MNTLPLTEPSIPRPARDHTSTTGNAPGISSDFQTFLRMLTAQMQNQNPLEPIEASDFAVQLATFSGVEQQVRTNTLLSQLASRMGLAEMAGWVGREALTSAPVYLDGAPRRLVPPEVPGADRAELVVTDRDGREVTRRAVDPRATEILFEMPNEYEGGVPVGHYAVKVESFRGGVSLGVAPVMTYARIDEARSDQGKLLLVLEGGHLIDSAQVAGLRK